MLIRSLFSAFCLALCLATAVAPARAAGLDDVIRALETPFQSATAKEYRINDYTADFFQESKIASLDRLQQANGRVSVAFNYQGEKTVPEVKFNWQYEQPTTQEIVSDGKTLWVYLPDNNQVILSDVTMVNQSRQNDPMTFLTGLGNLTRDFHIDWAKPQNDSDGNYVLSLQPQQPSSIISRLVIVIFRSSVEAYLKHSMDNSTTGPWFPIRSTTVYDPNGNSTVIEFSNLRINTGIHESTFKFILPAGVQVVRPTGKEMGF
jgi:outer membrane lipoprotein carrier protein